VKRKKEMTKVQLPFALAAPLDEQAMSRLADVCSTYGILRIQAEAGSEKLTVEYDATRFSPRDVEKVLARAGLPLAARSI
jgi:hypothetical protein